MKTITLLIVVLLLAGCGNPKVTRTNYHMVDVGMRLSEVEHMLGQPDWCDDFQRPTKCRWGTESKNIEVTFVAKSVVATESTGL